MKKRYLIAILFLATVAWAGQKVIFDDTIFRSSVKIGGTQSVAAVASALLELSSTTRALLLPRMTTAQRDALGSPTGGLFIYNTSTGLPNFYGSAWNSVESPASSLPAYDSASSGPVTLSSADDDIFVGDVTSGGFTVNLPDANGNQGKIFFIKKYDGTPGFNLLTIDGDGGDTIDGSATRVIATHGEAYVIVSDGTNWQILDHRIPSGQNSYTPSCTWSSNVTITGKWKRDGRSLIGEAHVEVTGSVGSPGTLSCDIPSGLTIDTSAIADPTPGNTSTPLGYGLYEDANGSDFWIGTSYVDTNSIRAVLLTSSTASLSTGNVSDGTPVATPASGDSINMRFTVPITNWEE